MFIWPFEVVLPNEQVIKLVAKKRPSKGVRNSVAGGKVKRSAYQTDAQKIAPITIRVQAAFRESLVRSGPSCASSVRRNLKTYNFEPSQLFIDTHEMRGQHFHVDAPLEEVHTPDTHDSDATVQGLTLSREFSTMVSFGLDEPARIDLKLNDGQRVTVQFPRTQRIANLDKSISLKVPCLAFNVFHAGSDSDGRNERRRLHYYCRPAYGIRGHAYSDKKYSISINSFEELSKSHDKNVLRSLLPTMEQLKNSLSANWVVDMEDRRTKKRKKVRYHTSSRNIRKFDDTQFMQKRITQKEEEEDTSSLLTHIKSKVESLEKNISLHDEMLQSLKKKHGVMLQNLVKKVDILISGQVENFPLHASTLMVISHIFS